MPTNDPVPGTEPSAAGETTGEMGDEELEAVVGGQPPVTKDPSFGFVAAVLPVFVDPASTGT